ncbi:MULTISPECIES: hypothetical protein [unclassified Paraburkholderia]|uniref:hypothetical protein n=1 Tax=unclassified Paraburkholderia TaxID=2615204 RepID=UPI0038BDB184
MLCLSTLLAPAGFAQALSYSQQFFEIMSDFQRDSTPPQPAGVVRPRRMSRTNCSAAWPPSRSCCATCWPTPQLRRLNGPTPFDRVRHLCAV